MLTPIGAPSCLLGREIGRLRLPLRLCAGFWSRSVARSGRDAPNALFRGCGRPCGWLFPAVATRLPEAQLSPATSSVRPLAAARCRGYSPRSRGAAPATASRLLLVYLPRRQLPERVPGVFSMTKPPARFALGCSRAGFSDHEIWTLERHGFLFEDLVAGDQPCITPTERRFVEVANGRRSPVTDHERLWRKYRERVEFESQQRRRPNAPRAARYRTVADPSPTFETLRHVVDDREVFKRGSTTR